MEEIERFTERLLEAEERRRTAAAEETAIEAARTLLQSRFRHESFLTPQQQEATLAGVRGRDVVALLPTGAGKSLCFQLAGVVRPGVTVVFSPLKALIEDQVHALRSLGLRAVEYHGDVAGDDREDVKRAIREGSAHFVYTTPETGLNSWFLDRLQHSPPSLFAVDEAHCISEWGHFFRPAYRELHVLKQRFPSIPVMATTATATAETLEDIVGRLALAEPEIITSSLDRPNIYLRALQRGKVGRALLAEAVKAHAGERGLIYCLTRPDTVRLAGFLRTGGIKAEPFHAGIGETEEETAALRQQVLARLRTGETKVVVATTAFGMGIDIPDIRFVINYGMPMTVEGYYQMIGRAGRDGRPADALLLYDVKTDTAVAERLLKRGRPSNAYLRSMRTKQRSMAAYAKNTSTCRRREVLLYFGQLSAVGCGACDNCARSEKDAPKRKSEPRQYGATGAWAKDDPVKHPKFGLGIVLAVEDKGRVRVKFSGGVTRLIDPTIGRLDRVR